MTQSPKYKPYPILVSLCELISFSLCKFLISHFASIPLPRARGHTCCSPAIMFLLSPPPHLPPRFQYALLSLILAYRASTLSSNLLTDCDEVYNYYEPLHFTLYGYGLQTWEYAEEYALRTYAFLMPAAAVGE